MKVVWEARRDVYLGFSMDGGKTRRNIFFLNKKIEKNK